MGGVIYMPPPRGFAISLVKSHVDWMRDVDVGSVSIGDRYSPLESTMVELTLALASSTTLFFKSVLGEGNGYIHA